MRKNVLFFLLCFFYVATYGQLVTGKVFDIQSKKPISLAAVYFHGTFVGTTTDQYGYFELNVEKYKSMPLTISAVGYYSYTLSDYSLGGTFDIYLEPKVYEIEEVVFSGKLLDRTRKANLRQFRKDFLGETRNAHSCEILNEEDISFYYDNESDTLRAFALKPIRIINKALGYNVTYYMDKFECCKNTLFFTGNILFTEDATTYKRFSERRRRNAYLGSRMHFFKSLWAKDLESARFKVTDSTGHFLDYKDIVCQLDDNKIFLQHPGSLNINYYAGWSKINFLKERVFFDGDGFFDPSGIRWEGNMGKKRIGDWLPYEFSFDK